MWGGGSTLVIISILFWFFWFFPRGTSCVVNSKPERRHIVRCCAFCFNHWKQFPVIFVLNSVKLTRIRAHCSCYRVIFFFALQEFHFMQMSHSSLRPPALQGVTTCLGTIINCKAHTWVGKEWVAFSLVEAELHQQATEWHFEDLSYKSFASTKSRNKNGQIPE